jgi:hypothetical protein
VLQSAQNKVNIMSSENEQLSEILSMAIEISQDLSTINDVLKSDAVAAQIAQVDMKIMQASELLLNASPPESAATLTPLIGTCEVIDAAYWFDIIFKACF